MSNSDLLHGNRNPPWGEIFKKEKKKKDKMSCPSPPVENSPPRLHPLSDIFPDSPPSTPPTRSPNNLATSASAFATAEANNNNDDVINVASDMPRLRATHSTAGYRDGIAAAKTQWLQPGFDEGYSLGAVLGLRVGHMLGVLEGLCAALVRGESGKKDECEEGKDEAGRAEGGTEEEAKRFTKLLAEAKTELALEKVFGKDWWGEDGIWKFPVEPAGAGAEKGHQNIDRKDDDEEGEEVTFVEVADQHPLLARWSLAIKAEMHRMGIQDLIFEGEDWESGRIPDIPE